MLASARLYRSLLTAIVLYMQTLARRCEVNAKGNISSGVVCHSRCLVEFILVLSGGVVGTRVRYSTVNFRW